MQLERVEAIHSALASMVIELSPDPGARGPGYLQDLISQTRGYLNTVSLYHQEVMREQHALERDLSAREAAYELSADSLLADDLRVTRLPNIDDRKAMISTILRDEKTHILDLKRGIRELGFVEKVVKHRHKELDNTVAALRMQKSLMDTEVRAGSFYGDESEVSRNKGGALGPNLTTDDLDMDELALLLGDESAPKASEPDESAVEEEEIPQPLGEGQAEQPKGEAEGVQEDPAITKFLEGDEILDDIFNSL